MNKNNNDDYGVIIETGIYTKKSVILMSILIIGILFIICLAIILNSEKDNIVNSNTQENKNEIVSSANDETSQQASVRAEYTPTEYKEYALSKVEELYDKECFQYAGYYQHNSSNEIRLQFLFNNTMSNDEYRMKIKENTEKIYNELKDKYIKKEHIADSKDISIYFTYYIYDEKSVSNMKAIWGYTIFYIDLLDNGTWPSIESDYTLEID